MAVTAQRGPGIGLPTFPLYGGNTERALAAGLTRVIPAGQYIFRPGPYSFLQTLDPYTGTWRRPAIFGNGAHWLSSDGVNLRVANLTGCAAAAFITNVGSAYTSAPVVTASSGGSTWTAIVGGAISQTITVGTNGAGYNYPPVVLISAPPPGGVQATAIATLSSGAIATAQVTVINQGAGYLIAPTVTFVPDAREALASTPGPTTTAVATTALTGAGTITALLCTNQGTPITVVPTLTFTGGGGSAAAATVVMCFVATGFTVGAGGAAYGNAQPFAVTTTGGIVSGAAGAVLNPSVGNGLFIPRQANISGTSTAGGAITATGAVINDGGMFQAVPQGIVTAGGSGLATTVGQATITVGGVTDYYDLQPI